MANIARKECVLFLSRTSCYQTEYKLTFHVIHFLYFTLFLLIVAGVLDGIEMRMFLEISRRLNFTWRIQEPPEINKYGQRFENGSWSGGVFGALAEGRADVGLCNLFLIHPRQTVADFTLPWATVCFTFLVPRPHRLNQLRAVFLPFTTSLWVAITAATGLIACVLWWMQRKCSGLNTDIGNGKYRNFR
jgi:hypothetical protein